MNPIELRIGNIVSIENETYWPKIKNIPMVVTGMHQVVQDSTAIYSIDLEHLERKKNTYYESYSQFQKFVKPILLTEKWLLRFGFKKYETAMIKSYNYIKTKDGAYQIMVNSALPTLFCIEDLQLIIRYVHELQNLYFTIYKEEISLDQNDEEKEYDNNKDHFNATMLKESINK